MINVCAKNEIWVFGDRCEVDVSTLEYLSTCDDSDFPLLLLCEKVQYSIRVRY